MTRRPGRSSRRRPRAAVTALLLALVCLAAGAPETSPPLHLHEADTAGLYNEEHVLGNPDSVRGGLPLPDARGAVFIALVAGACLTAAGARLSAPALDLAESRAPPLA